MKIRFLLTGSLVATFFIVTTSIFNDVHSNESGAPAGKTGSPRDGSSCTSCHTPATNFTGAGTISSNIPTDGYTAGQTYTITAGIVRNGHVRFGFEVSPQDTTTARNYIGTMKVTNTTATQLVSTNYITHKSAGTDSTNRISWSFNWTAPATGKGPAVFYGAFNASNDNGESNGDSIFLTSYKVYECIAPGQPGSITGSTSLCANSSLSYSINPVSGATSYNWTLPSGWTGTSTTSSINVTAGTASGTISVTATNSCGTSTATTLPVTVTSANEASVSISASKDTICSGTEVTFAASPTNGGTAPIYQWKLNGANVGSGSTGYSNSDLSNGDKVSCDLTSNMSCVTQNPATSNTITIVVNPLLPVSVSITASQDTICNGTTVNFTTNPTNGGTDPAYQWMKNGASINGQTSPVYSSSTLANRDFISVSMNSSATCPSSTLVVSDSIEITVNPVVVPAITITSNSGSSICANQEVTFSATPENGGTSPGFQWFKNGSPVSGQISSTYASSLFSNGDSVSLLMISDATCASPDTVVSNALVMNIVDNATPSVTITSNTGDSICQGQSVIFIAQPVVGGTAPAYQWLKNGAALAADTLSTYSTSTLANGDSIYVNMISNSACVVTPFAFSNGIVMDVIPAVTPTIQINPDSGFSICPGQEVLFTSAITNAGNSPVYQWTNKGANISGQNSSSYLTSSLSNGDVVSCLLTSSAQCASPVSVLSSPDTIQTYTVVKPNIIYNSDTLLIADQESTFQWFLNDSSITGAVGQTWVATANGNYSVQVIDLNGCSSLSDTVNITLLGITGLSIDGVFSVYPNPTDGIIYLEWAQAFNPGSVDIKLYDINGRLVLENHSTTAALDQIKIDMHSLDNGIYLLTIRDDKNSYTTKLVKE